MLKEELTGVIGRPRRFILLRIAGFELTEALRIVDVKQSRYNHWTMEEKFQTVYRKLAELTDKYRDEAIKLLRRENQLAAVMLEADVIEKLREEVETGIYDLLKTKLGASVYDKLVTDLDKVPTISVQNMTWEQRILAMNSTPQIAEVVIDAVPSITTPEECTEAEYGESKDDKEA